MAAKPRKIQLIFLIYWILLGYIMAALVFWFIALNRQNRQMTLLKEEKLDVQEASYQARYSEFELEKRRKTAQYLGEGSIFMLLIVAGAVFVYRAVRRQLKISQEQQQFMIAVAHELKTPISVARLNLETLQKRKLDERQQQRLIRNTLQEANRLDALCNNMLLSSQLEAGGYSMTNEELNWSDIIQSCTAEFTVRYPEREIKQQVSPDVFVTGDPFMLGIVVNNLLENAVKYTPKETEITITLSKHGTDAMLEIADRGAGIAEEEKKKIFQKFYRIGNEATRRAKGTGLGLYLASRIISRHNGKISISNNPGGGSVFSIRLKAES